jgi:hypothetical protein
MGAVELSLDAPEAWALGEEHRRFLSPGVAPLLRVHARAREVGRLPPVPDPRAVIATRRGDAGTVATRDVRARWRRVAPGRYEAEAEVADPRFGPSHLMTALVAATTEAEGGLVLHAVALVADARPVLLLGPTDAGKTTAAEACRTARWIARDRVAVLPGADGWVLWGMPGGDPLSTPQAPPGLHRVGRALRVRRAAGATRVVPLSPAAAVARVRECVQAVAGGDLLASVADLCQHASVAQLTGDLVGPLDALVFGDG